ncbi:TonB-dependent receptor [Mesonia aestuariivivens]|uniref:TonB-dependent receptor n=1 Tax=Mesonia aestuariivivens TaxID=2796128 RepID=A0ABS6VY69_9FLAO|nr:TonB-dependent receptor [Mesonia aestuariivivens]MBW2960535.1 TonB-dependent receptor [Mesonia aestuariivivens]
MRFIIIVLLLCSCSSYGQKLFTGQVISDENNQVLEGVVVTETKSNSWTITNTKGYFSIKITDLKNFELNFKILGKKEEELTYEDIEDLDSIVTIRLKDENIKLDDVTVTAVPKRSKVGSALVLDDYAVNQLQSFSLSDILQQLPGQKIQPPDFTKTKILNLRTAGVSNTNAFGIAYMIDGLQISNDENMQTYDGGSNNGLTSLDNPSNGLDLNTIPASNIEKIEVIAGIPDAEYGNLTTGLIKIDRKAGLSPYRVRASLRQGTTQVSLDKGYNLGQKAGNLSFSINYLNANNNPTDQLNNYDRLTASAIWTVNSKDKKLRNSFSLNFHDNLNDVSYDKENESGKREAKFKKDKGIRLSNRLFWNANTAIVDNIEFNTGFSYAKQHSYKQFFINNGGQVIPTAMETNLYTGNYTPVSYLSVKEVFGQPLNLNTKVSIRKSFSNKRLNHNLSVGFNFSYSDNKGRGPGFDPDEAYSNLTIENGGTGDVGFRPTSYRNLVTPRKNYGIYFQDNSTYTFANGHDLFANIGVRYDNQNGFSSVSPRINFGYELSRKWSIRGGVGFASKAPSLSQIFPSDKYYDYLIRDIRTNDYAFNLVQTYKIAIDKLDLEPSKIWKYELGTNYNANFANFSLTAYYNRTFDGIVGVKQLVNFDYPEVKFTYPEDNSAPDYQVMDYSNRVETYSLPQNSQKTIDAGLEFFATFKKIEAINTSFSFSGRYVYTENNSFNEFITSNSDQANTDVPYGVFKSFPSKSDDLKFRGTASYHLSELGLLISLTAEQFTRKTTYATIESIYPFAYINGNGDRIPIIQANRDNQEFEGLLQNPSNSRDIVKHLYHNFHLRLTKEFENNLSLSMYVTNFLNHQPMVKNGNSELIENSSISFGAQINYQF